MKNALIDAVLAFFVGLPSALPAFFVVSGFIFRILEASRALVPSPCALAKVEENVPDRELEDDCDSEGRELIAVVLLFDGLELSINTQSSSSLESSTVGIEVAGSAAFIEWGDTGVNKSSSLKSSGLAFEVSIFARRLAIVGVTVRGLFESRGSVLSSLKGVVSREKKYLLEPDLDTSASWSSFEEDKGDSKDAEEKLCDLFFLSDS